jgi:SAM-dependent methyltransferase
MAVSSLDERVKRASTGGAKSTNADFSGVTELPGNLAHREQLSILYTRYHWAAQHCRDKDVLEAGCGAGQGLGYLRQVARRVVGGDIEEKCLAFARQYYNGRDGIEIRLFDAENFPFDDRSFDTVILFEAIYYLKDPLRFLAESRRVLRPRGTLLISSVNCQWHGFNPSPFSTHYYPAAELLEITRGSGFRPQLWAGFRDTPDSLRRRTIARLRKMAVALHLIPGTMRGKALLKRLFYGPLQAVPAEVQEGMATLVSFDEVGPQELLNQYKMLYLAGQKCGE